MKTLLFSITTAKGERGLEARVTDEVAELAMDATNGGARIRLDGVLVASVPAWVPGPLRSIWLRINQLLRGG